MRLLLATHSLDHVGGSETYLLTVGEQLQRLGHDVTLHAVEAGACAELARSRGIEVEDEIPGTCDAAIVQDAGMAHALAERLPGVPQLHVAHSDLHDVQLPAIAPGAPTAVVVLSERVARRVEALDPAYRVVRLRQPVDTERFTPLGSPHERPRRALLLGNYQQHSHRRLLEQAWEPHGVELRIAGLRGTPALDPADEIAQADIVVGKGRAILDAMACGRPAYVYDDFGTDGWVTPEAHPAMEADGFAGQSTARVADRERLERDLLAYDPAMGIAGRELVLLHHKARNHAHELVAVLRSLTPAAAASSASTQGELARNVRLRWVAERELVHLRTARGDLVDAVRAAEQRAEIAAQWAGACEERAVAAESAADEARARARAWDAAASAAAEHAEAVLGQRRVRAGVAAGRIADRVRGLVRR